MNAVTITVFSALAGSFLTYLAAVRRLSGKIQTSEAADLWKASQQLREEYRLEVSELRTLIISLRRRISEVEERNANLQSENQQCQREIQELKKEKILLENRVKELEVINGRG